MWWLLLAVVFFGKKGSGPIGAGANPQTGGNAYTGVGYDPTQVNGTNGETPPLLGTAGAGTKADGSQTPPIIGGTYDGTGGTSLAPGPQKYPVSSDSKRPPPASGGPNNAYLKNVPGAKA
jgi:hypothetical protein